MDFAPLLAAVDSPPLSMELRIPLSALNFLEFAIWGAWFVVLGQYLNAINFSRKAIGSIYATMSLGAIFSPMFVGAIADRYFAAQLLMGVLHLIGAGLLCWMAYIHTERKFFWVTLLYSLVYTPTMSLTNAVGLANIPDSNRDFPMIRVFGTIGWIAANLALKLVLKPGQPVNNRPLLLAAVLSLVLGVFSFFLPNTPPAASAEGLTVAESFSAFFSTMGDAVGLLKETQFATFFGVSLLISIALAFYYSFTSLYLEKRIGVRPDNVGPLMTLGQWVELAVMFTLPWFLATLGIKWVLAVGMAAWGVRYAIFALEKPFALIVFAVAIHGICFDFFFAAGMIHVGNIAPEFAKASAQALFLMVTYGIGMYLGTEASGWLNQALTTKVVDPKTGAASDVTDWRTFWAVPAVGSLVSLVLFLILT